MQGDTQRNLKNLSEDQQAILRFVRDSKRAVEKSGNKLGAIELTKADYTFIQAAFEVVPIDVLAIDGIDIRAGAEIGDDVAVFCDPKGRQFGEVDLLCGGCKKHIFKHLH